MYFELGLPYLIITKKTRASDNIDAPGMYGIFRVSSTLFAISSASGASSGTSFLDLCSDWYRELQCKMTPSGSPIEFFPEL